MKFLSIAIALLFVYPVKIYSLPGVSKSKPQECCEKMKKNHSNLKLQQEERISGNCEKEHSCCTGQITLSIQNIELSIPLLSLVIFLPYEVKTVFEKEIFKPPVT